MMADRVERPYAATGYCLAKTIYGAFELVILDQPSAIMASEATTWAVMEFHLLRLQQNFYGIKRIFHRFAGKTTCLGHAQVRAEKQGLIAPSTEPAAKLRKAVTRVELSATAVTGGD